MLVGVVVAVGGLRVLVGVESVDVELWPPHVPGVVVSAVGVSLPRLPLSFGAGSSIRIGMGMLLKLVLVLGRMHGEMVPRRAWPNWAVLVVLCRVRPVQGN